jgi:hypothetical protein
MAKQIDEWRTAHIDQLIPMPDRWEFHYLQRDEDGTTQVVKIPMLGLALVRHASALLGEQRSVYFGPGQLMDNFSLYADMGGDDIYPFWQEMGHSHTLGVAPANSSDDYFASEIEQGKSRLDLEHEYGPKIRALAKMFKAKTGTYGVATALDKYFRLTCGTYRSGASREDWQKVFSTLDEIRAARGDDVAIGEILKAGQWNYAALLG